MVPVVVELGVLLSGANGYRHTLLVAQSGICFRQWRVLRACRFDAPEGPCPGTLGPRAPGHDYPAAEGNPSAEHSRLPRRVRRLSWKHRSAHSALSPRTKTVPIPTLH